MVYLYRMSRGNYSIVDLDTYVFIDVSNIRAACLKTLGLRLNFEKLYCYLRQKYKRLKDVYYFEGIADDDQAKTDAFERLQELGYSVKTLSRKAYVKPAMYKEVKCRKCGNVQRTQVLKRSISLKSNVDVYLATELLSIAYLAKRPVHLMLVSCDGDYAEMIKNAILRNENVMISVLATPSVRDMNKNTLSIRLKKVYNDVPLHRYELNNIYNIRGLIS